MKYEFIILIDVDAFHIFLKFSISSEYSLFIQILIVQWSDNSTF